MIATYAQTLKMLMTAIDEGGLITLKTMLAIQPDLANARFHTDPPRTPLLYLADWPGHKPNAAEIARILIETGADVNAKLLGNTGETALHCAASSDDIDLIEALLEGGADIDIGGANIASGTPLTEAVFFSQMNAAELLVRRGATVTLPLAAGLGRLSWVQHFFGEWDGLVGQPTPDDQLTTTSKNMKLLGEEALTYAALNGHIDVASYLLEQGVDIDAMPMDEQSKRTALHFAVLRDQRDMAQFLVEHGADLLLQDEMYGATPLEWAKHEGKEEIISYLMSVSNQ
ncbi:MAG: ankyrin repeat domain-containing protein [Chloroflexota bacterium]